MLGITLHMFTFWVLFDRRYGADIARGVAELHAAGVVCMNLKPSNLLLDANGHAVVSDYGLPAILKKPACRKAQSECDSSGIHSCMDCTMLSPHYTAPEAWEPPVKKPLNIFWDDAIGISPESDAWSFGCTLVEMCTGSIPYVTLHLLSPPPSLLMVELLNNKIIFFVQVGWFKCRGNLSSCCQVSQTTSSICRCSWCWNT